MDRRGKAPQSSTSNPAAGAATNEGYRPADSVAQAEAYQWVTLQEFMSTLRKLLLVDFMNTAAGDEVRSVMKDLPSKPAPFGTQRRFPSSEVYVCPDRPPLNRLMWRLVRAASGSNYAESYDALRDTWEALEKEGDENRVIYNRDKFESVFRLEWRSV